MWTLCLLTFPHKWNVDSPLKISLSKKPFSSISACSSVQKVILRWWSFGCNFCCSMRRYGFSFSLFCKMHHTVGCGMPSSLLPLTVNFLGLRTNACLTCSICSSVTDSLPVLIKNNCVKSLLLWCAVCSSYSFLHLECSLLRWRQTAVRRRFVCLYFMNASQLQLSSGNSAPNLGNNHHLTIPFEGGMHNFKRQGACVNWKALVGRLWQKSKWSRSDRHLYGVLEN